VSLDRPPSPTCCRSNGVWNFLATAVEASVLALALIRAVRLSLNFWRSAVSIRPGVAKADGNNFFPALH
jgi:hypothetical protein